MTTLLKRAQMYNLLPESTIQKVLKQLKANLCSRLQELNVGSKSLSARVKVGLKFPKTNHATTQGLSTCFLVLYAICYQHTAIGDMNCGNFEECFTLICDNDSPCPGGGARINLVTSDNKCDSVCIGMGGADGFPDGWRDLGQVPLDPCKLVPGACGGSRPGDDGEPDDADSEQEQDEQDSKPCGAGDVFVPIKGNGARHCVHATAECDEIGAGAAINCRLMQLDRFEHRCQAGFLANGRETDPIPCELTAYWAATEPPQLTYYIDCAGQSTVSEKREQMFTACISGYERKDGGVLSNIECYGHKNLAIQSCQDHAKAQCRAKCFDSISVFRGEDATPQGNQGRGISYADILDDRDLTDAERAVTRSLKDRTVYGASVLETIGIASFMGGNEELGTEILRTYTKLYPNDPRSWELLSEAYRRRGWPASSESASKIGERLHRD